LRRGRPGVFRHHRSGGGGAPDLGIPRYPAVGADIVAITPPDYAAIYARPAAANIRIGALWNDPAQPAFVAIDPLLARHFGIFGMTGTGKSSAVILILSAILTDHENAHIVVIDPHNEYSAAFGDLAEAVDVDNLDLPFWLLDSEEAVEILVRGGTMREQESQEIILKEAMLRARRQCAGEAATMPITVDTPVPFRISDVIRFIDEAMGRLDNPDNAAPYLRLTNRIKSLRDDRRFAFMFADQLVLRDTLARIVGRLLRIPAGGKPVSVIDLSGVPSEIADVVVSVICRIAFDFCRA
jgi:DNA helicase HerA-like ATPase